MFNKIKENYKYLIYCLILAVIFCIPYYSNKIYDSIDLSFHINRIISITDAWRDGQIIPRVYPYTNNGYGYASPLFYCDLYLYPFAILYLLRINVFTVYKIMMFIYIVFGNVCMLIFLKKITSKSKKILLGLTIYSLANYRLVDTLSRSAVGESMAISFLPLLMISVYELLVNKKECWLFLGVSFSLMMFAHNLTFALCCIIYGFILIIFLIFNHKDKYLIKRIIFVNIKAILLALLLTSWFTMPMLEQLFDQKLFIHNLSNQYNLENTYIGMKTFLELFLRLDNMVYETPGSVNLIGIPVMVTTIICLFTNKSNRLQKTSAVFTLVLILCSLGFIPLGKIKIFNSLQFSFRLFALVIPFSVIACTWIDNKYLVLFISLFAIVNSLFYSYQIIGSEYNISDSVSRDEYFSYNSNYGKDYNEKEIIGGEYLPATEIVNYNTDSKFIKRIVDGGYEEIVYDFNRYFSKITFEYNTCENEIIMLPLTYYKGYIGKAVKNNVITDLELINNDDYHMICFLSNGSGNNYYEIHYKGTLVQKISLYTSLITAIYVIYKGNREHGKEKSIIC